MRKPELTSWDLESCVLMRDVAAITSLQCKSLSRGQRAIPGKADRHRVNKQLICCCFLSLEVSAEVLCCVSLAEMLCGTGYQCLKAPHDSQVHGA